MKSIIVFVVCLCTAFSAAFEYESCDCVPVLKCFPAVSKLKSYHKDRVKHNAFTEYLKIINCGYEGKRQLVCCPAEIPAEVIEIVGDKKYWSTKTEEQKSIKRLKYANLKAKNLGVPLKNFDSAKSSPPQFLKKHGQFPECGKIGRPSDFIGRLTETKDYPWLALLEYNTPGGGKKVLCGGALISDQHILTAARCLTSGSNKLASVILGEYDTNTNPDCVPDGDNQKPSCTEPVRRYNVDRAIIHEQYNDGISHRDFMDDGFGPDLHDIALIKLKEKVKFTDYIQPICLPLVKPKNIRKFRVAGWGRSFVPGNKGFNLKLMSYLSQCDRAEYDRPELDQIYDKNEHICAGKPHRDQKPCIVDSGGPLMAVEVKESGVHRMTVYGISFMEMTCENIGQPKDLPGIFTNVYNYKDWIIQHVNS